MFGRSYRLPFTLLGIPILLDLSFLLILPLLAWMIGSNAQQIAEAYHLPHPEALGRGAMPYLLGLVAAIGLFICVVLHELGHAITARYYHVEVKHITLWFLGGVAAFDEMPRQRGAEAVVAIVGPIVSLALAGVCWGLAMLVSPDSPALFFVARYLAATNAILAIFNLLPALPLDGGRVLRSLLALRMPHRRATEIAARLSKILAVLLGIVGLMTLQLFLLAIAFFIYMAVAAETQGSQFDALLRGLPVRQVMNRAVKTVTPELTLEQFIQAMLRERHIGFPVVDPTSQRPVGMIHLADIQGKDASMRVADVMSRDVPSIGDRADALDAFREMGRRNFGRLVVLDDAGDLAGIISKADLINVIKIRAVSEGVPHAPQVAASRAPEVAPGPLERSAS